MDNLRDLPATLARPLCTCQYLRRRLLNFCLTFELSFQVSDSLCRRYVEHLEPSGVQGLYLLISQLLYNLVNLAPVAIGHNDLIAGTQFWVDQNLDQVLSREQFPEHAVS